MDYGQQRAQKNICSVILPLDVETRWNSLYCTEDKNPMLLSMTTQIGLYNGTINYGLILLEPIPSAEVDVDRLFLEGSIGVCTAYGNGGSGTAGTTSGYLWSKSDSE